MVRATLEFSVPGTAELPEDLDSSPMIERDPRLQTDRLTAEPGAPAGEYLVKDLGGRVVLRTLPPQPPAHPWSRLLPDPDPVFDAIFSPDGTVDVPLMAHDTFFPAHRESIGVGCVFRGGTARLSVFSLHARPGERFLGTGERFSRFGLFRHP
jgi:alpha-D-xyloside xylohydrolase